MNISITILENNFDVEYDFKITSPGSPGTAPSFSYPGDPPEPPEIKLEVLGIARAAKPQEALELPEWLKELLEEELLQRDEIWIVVYDAASKPYDPGE